MSKGVPDFRILWVLELGLGITILRAQSSLELYIYIINQQLQGHDAIDEKTRRIVLTKKRVRGSNARYARLDAVKDGGTMHERLIPAHTSQFPLASTSVRTVFLFFFVGSLRVLCCAFEK